MSLSKWTRHGQGPCMSVCFWEVFGAVLSPLSCCWLFTHIVKDSRQGSAMVRLLRLHLSGLIGEVQYPVA